MLAAIPLMIVPLVLYNIIMLGFIGNGVSDLAATVTSFQMMSGATWTMSWGDVLIVISLVLLFIEVLKATRTGAWSVIDHMLSMLVFIAFLVEFLLVRDAATQVFFHPDGDRLCRCDRRLLGIDPVRRAGTSRSVCRATAWFHSIEKPRIEMNARLAFHSQL
jgi:hypothetical protein